MKIFRTTNISTVRLCQYYLDIMPLEYQLDLNQYKFLVRNKFVNNPIHSDINRILCNQSCEFDDLITKYDLVTGDNFNAG
jgi:hypothetical protein